MPQINMKAAFMISISLVLAIYILSSASALGVTPARTSVIFSPGASQKVDFSVINSEHKDMDIVVFVQGELNQSVSLPVNSFSMSSSDDSKRLSYEFSLPSSMTPGTHTAEIVVLQLPEKAKSSDAYVGSAVAVVTQLSVSVPYPGKYAQADLNIVNSEQGGEATFIIPVVNMGKLDLAHVQANIDIYDKSGNKVDSFNTADIAIPSGQRADIVSKWAAAVPVGEYRAVATLVYDGETINLERKFNVGNSLLEVQQIQVNNFKLGEIAKFDMTTENKWSEPILGAYAQTQVFDKSNEVMADFKSPTYDVPPLSNITMTSYWDTAGVHAGTYDTTISLKYGEKSTQQNLQLKVTGNGIEAIGLGYVISETKSSSSSGLTTILISGIVVLVLINAVWFLIIRKRLKK